MATGYLIRKTPNVSLEYLPLESEILDFDRRGRTVEATDPSSVIRVDLLAGTATITNTDNLECDSIRVSEYGPLLEFLGRDPGDKTFIRSGEFEQALLRGYQTVYQNPNPKEWFSGNTIYYFGDEKIRIVPISELYKRSWPTHPDTCVAPTNDGIWTNGHKTFDLYQESGYHVLLFQDTFVFLHRFLPLEPVPILTPDDPITLDLYHGSDLLGSGVVSKSLLITKSAFFKNLFDDCPDQNLDRYRLQFDIFDPRKELPDVITLLNLFFLTLNGGLIPLCYRQDFVLFKWLFMLHERIDSHEPLKEGFGLYFDGDLDSLIVHFHAYLRLIDSPYKSPGIIELIPPLDRVISHKIGSFLVPERDEEVGSDYFSITLLWIEGIVRTSMTSGLDDRDPRKPFLDPWLWLDQCELELSRILALGPEEGQSSLAILTEPELEAYDCGYDELGQWFETHRSEMSLQTFIVGLATISNAYDDRQSYLSHYLEDLALDQTEKLIDDLRKEKAPSEVIGALRLLARI